MKAWVVWDWQSYEGYQTIVFAETRGKARAIALYTDACQGGKFTDIMVRREPRADKLYKGQCEIDWWDEETRVMLVRDLGWTCTETSGWCADCPAREYCALFDDDLEEYGA